MNIKQIEPAIRKYNKKINSYPGVQTASSCQGHVRKVDTRTIRIEGRIINLQPAISVMRPYVCLIFTGNRKFWAFLQQVVRKKMVAVIYRKDYCKICLRWSDYEEVFQYNPKGLKQFKTQIKAERKQIFETVIKAL